MARERTSARAAWFICVVSAGLTFTLVVDWAVFGKGFSWTTAAMLFVLWPHALSDLLRVRGHHRAAGRARAAGSWSPFLATAALWAGLVLGWTRGEGTDWLALAAGLLLPAAGVLWLAGRLTGRRPRRARGPSGDRPARA
ncbi:hypothetical protein [Streptomyces griseocarneus]|uniref:hypothetical protein n=1 Tax=Streptomyces griseocarneus TaxID=51201 RepID=UPI00167EAC69|nr:hypothetical protein [Streptomyces griseocarneus]MBZ6472314.1 hypothetical protein [Streptomyces griseocarneus]GHG72675.1 hypothetical protein GCM10018779_48210 [Streptomyces griseocarneus]